MSDPMPNAAVDVTTMLAPERDALLDLLGRLAPDDWLAPTA